jgi:hypothetical protein
VEYVQRELYRLVDENSRRRSGVRDDDGGTGDEEPAPGPTTGKPDSPGSFG